MDKQFIRFPNDQYIRKSEINVVLPFKGSTRQSIIFVGSAAATHVVNMNPIEIIKLLEETA